MKNSMQYYYASITLLTIFSATRSLVGSESESQKTSTGQETVNAKVFFEEDLGRNPTDYSTTIRDGARKSGVIKIDNEKAAKITYTSWQPTNSNSGNNPNYLFRIFFADGRLKDLPLR